MKKTQQTRRTPPTKALIYCRVSSDKQVSKGDGLGSQESACRAFAEQRGLKVIKVFKDEGVSGALVERPAFNEMLAYADAHPKERFAAIFPDIKRLARDLEAHIEIVAKLKSRHFQILSPTHDFGESSADKFVTNILACAAGYEREANQEQVVSRQKARMLDGYAVFGRPNGYRWVKDTSKGGKVLVPAEPAASAVRELFEGFAYGRFETFTEAARWLEQDGRLYLGKNGKFDDKRVVPILTNIFHAGYLDYPERGVNCVKGRHEPLISLEVFEKVQERLGLRPKIKHRKDINEDFPLRGFVLCDCCGEPLTASWSTSRNGKKHAYYRCKTPKATCVLSGKSIPMEKLETDMVAILKQMVPSAPAARMAEAMVTNLHGKKKAQFRSSVKSLQAKRDAIAKKISNLIDRTVKSDDPLMQQAYEDEIKKLKREQALLDERAEHFSSVDTSLEAALGTVMEFLNNPHAIWMNGGFEDKRLVLRLAFAKAMRYSKSGGFGTTETTLPYCIMKQLEGGKGRMVDPSGIEPLTSTMPSWRSPS